MLLQVVLSASVLALLLMVGFSLHWQSALIVGLGLAMSSTALVMSTLSSTNQLATSHGRTSLAVLTAQDMSIVPVMALIPLLAHHATETPDGSALPKVGLALGFLVIAGSMIVTPLMIRLGGSLAQRIHDEPAFKPGAYGQDMSRHLVIVGMDSVGHLVALMAERAQVPHIAFDWATIR